VGSGYSEVDNVNVKGGGGFTDFQDSFLFAEVFKYSYLIQAAVSLLFSSVISSFASGRGDSYSSRVSTTLMRLQDASYQVNTFGVNDFVFNTEAHPIRVAGKPI
jgi:mannosyl-oligosaccharide alpha-1,2-mannosidase